MASLFWADSFTCTATSSRVQSACLASYVWEHGRHVHEESNLIQSKCFVVLVCRDQSEQVVSPAAEVVCVRRALGDEFLILGTDGVWDVLSNQVRSLISRTCFDFHIYFYTFCLVLKYFLFCGYILRSMCIFPLALVQPNVDVGLSLLLPTNRVTRARESYQYYCWRKTAMDWVKATVCFVAGPVVVFDREACVASGFCSQATQVEPCVRDVQVPPGCFAIVKRPMPTSLCPRSNHITSWLLAIVKRRMPISLCPRLTHMTSFVIVKRRIPTSFCPRSKHTSS